jgi:hypothetical protein
VKDWTEPRRLQDQKRQYMINNERLANAVEGGETESRCNKHPKLKLIHPFAKTSRADSRFRFKPQNYQMWRTCRELFDQDSSPIAFCNATN